MTLQPSSQVRRKPNIVQLVFAIQSVDPKASLHVLAKNRLIVFEDLSRNLLEVLYYEWMAFTSQRLLRAGSLGKTYE
jgi:hypothetical protein